MNKGNHYQQKYDALVNQFQINDKNIFSDSTKALYSKSLFNFINNSTVDIIFNTNIFLVGLNLTI